MAAGSAKRYRYEYPVTVIIAADGLDEAYRIAGDLRRELIAHEEIVNVQAPDVPSYRRDLDGAWPDPGNRERRLA